VYSDDLEASDLSLKSDNGSLSDASADSDDSDEGLPPLSPAEEAEHENFGNEYFGPCLSEKDAKRLLVLMAHASTCPGR
jgi:hypothetical protein